MHPRTYLELLKQNIKHSYKKLILDQNIEHGIEHISHEQHNYLLDAAVATGTIGSAAEIGSLVTWGEVAGVFSGIASAMNVGTAVLIYGWTWSQMPTPLYGAFYDSYSFRDRDIEPLGRIPIRQKTIHELQQSSNLEFSQIYNLQNSNNSQRQIIPQNAEELIKNNERADQRIRQGEIHYTNAEAFYTNDQPIEAIASATRAIELSPNYARPYLLRAAAKFYLAHDITGSFTIEDLQNISYDVNQVVKLAPQDNSLIEYAQLIYRETQPELYYRKACKLHTQGKFQEALNTVKVAFDLFPAKRISSKIFALQADCYNELGRYAEALVDYEQLAERFPDKHSSFVNSMINELKFKIHYQKADDLYNQKNDKDAITEATHAIQLKPEYCMSYLIRAASQFNLGQYRNDYSIEELNNILQDLKQFFQLASQDDPLFAYAKSTYRIAESELLYRKAHDLLSKDQFQAAINTLNSLLKLNPEAKTCADVYVVRAHCYFDLQKFTQAFADFDQAISLNPKYATAVKKIRDEYNQWLEQKRKSQADYNKQVAAYQQQVAAYQQQVAAYQQQVAAYNAAVQAEQKRYIRSLNMQVSRDMFSNWLSNGNYALGLAKQRQQQADAQHAASMAKFQQQQQALQASQDLYIKQMQQASQRNFTQRLEANHRNFESLIFAAKQEMSKSSSYAATTGLFKTTPEKPNANVLSITIDHACEGSNSAYCKQNAAILKANGM